MLVEFTGESHEKVYVNPQSVAGLSQSAGAVNVWMHAIPYPIRVLSTPEEVAKALALVK